MSAELTGRVLRLRIHSITKLVLIALADAANADGVGWPSMKRLCEFTSLHERTVRVKLRELEQSGILRREWRFEPGGRQTSSWYTLILPDGEGAVRLPPPSGDPPEGASSAPPEGAVAQPPHSVDPSEDPSEGSVNVTSPASADAHEEQASDQAATTSAPDQPAAPASAPAEPVVDQQLAAIEGWLRCMREMADWKIEYEEPTRRHFETNAITSEQALLAASALAAKWDSMKAKGSKKGYTRLDLALRNWALREHQGRPQNEQRGYRPPVRVANENQEDAYSGDEWRRTVG